MTGKRGGDGLSDDFFEDAEGLGAWESGAAG
jgi:hypothetical protein